MLIGTSAAFSVRKSKTRAGNTRYRLRFAGRDWSDKEVENLNSIKIKFPENFSAVDKARVETKWQHKLIRTQTQEVTQ